MNDFNTGNGNVIALSRNSGHNYNTGRLGLKATRPRNKAESYKEDFIPENYKRQKEIDDMNKITRKIQ